MKDPFDVRSDRFDWRTDLSVLIRRRAALAVYRRAGRIIFRQERAWDEDEDAIIEITPECALAVARAIIDAAGIPVSALREPPNSAETDEAAQ